MMSLTAQKNIPINVASMMILYAVWNYCEFTPKEEQDRIIASKEFEKKPKNKRNTGGIIKSAIKIQTQEEYEAEKLELELKEKIEIKE